MSTDTSRWDVLDWRRQVADLYRAVREEPVPARAHARWVAGRDRLLAAHPASPVPPVERDAFAGARVAAYDPAFRFVVPVDLDVDPVRRDVATGTDGVVPLERIGRVDLPGLGALDVWWTGVYGGGVFVPLRDATSGRTTYGGGRYLLDTVKGADLGGDTGGLVLDLNFAYQPSCAYDDAWACPLPGPGNTLRAPVPVGEQHTPRPVGEAFAHG
jgi:uncharacterized protein (DUF1684 family)